MERIFSDGLFLIQLVEAGPAPYYNVAYVPSGFVLYRLLEPLVGWSVDTALTLFSAVLMALGVWGTLRLGLRLGLRTGPLVVAGLLLLCSPGALFFGSTVEVHAMQFAGAAWALNLAWSAREKRGAAAWRLLALAFVVAFLAHLSNAIILPGLWLLARRSSALDPADSKVSHGCHVSKRGLPWIAGASLIIAAIVGYLSTLEFSEWIRQNEILWVSALVIFIKNFVESALERGLYELFEMHEYLNIELVTQSALLLAGLFIGAFAWARLLARRAFETEAGEFVARAFPMILPALFIFPQGGIWEHGAYFLTYYPAFALSIAWALDRTLGAKLKPTAWTALAVVLAAPQLWLALDNRSAYRNERIDARAWMAVINEQIGPGDSVITSTLARMNALEYERPDLTRTDLKRRMDSVPARGRSELLIEEVGQAIRPLVVPEGAGKSMWLDMDLFKRGLGSASEDWRDQLRGLLEQPGIQVKEFPTPNAELLRIRFAR
ncbi:MAG: hypothetical protein ACI9D0_000119 [Bacteroidia bacterium]|jgi:hypothetical protein